MHKIIIDLTTLDLILIIIAIVSLIINLIQWRENKSLKDPLSNSLVAMFNDIKSKSNNVYLVYNSIFNKINPHENVNTLKWEYGLFAQSILSFLNGFQEQMVGLLATVNPMDKTGQKIFNALDYGLTERDKQNREEYLKRDLESFKEAGKKET